MTQEQIDNLTAWMKLQEELNKHITDRLDKLEDEKAQLECKLRTITQEEDES